MSNKKEDFKLHRAPDMYAYYKKLYPESNVTFTLYKHVISQFNKKMADRLLEGETIHLGKNMGRLRIKKVERNHSKPVVDFGETRKLKAKGIDKIVYFTNRFYYRWFWDKKPSKAVNKSAYSLKVTKGPNGLTRRLARLLKADEFANLNFKQ